MKNIKSILFVTRNLPDSSYSGVSIREIGIARQLSKSFHIDIVYQKPLYSDITSDLPFRKLIYIPNSMFEVLFQTLKAFVTGSSLHERDINSKLVNFIDNSDYDFVYFSWIYTAINIKNIKSSKIYITDLVDANSWHYYESKPKSYTRRIYYFLERNRLLKEELFSIEKSHITIVSTSNEKEYFQQSVNKLDIFKKIMTVTNGVDIPKRELIIQKNDSFCEFRIGFIGSLNWYPNQEAVEVLIEKIYPKLKEQFTNIKLYIIGKENPYLTNKYKEVEDIIFTGFINNLEEFLPSIELMIFPLKVASGIQNKLITSFAYGIPAIFPPRMIFKPQMEYLNDVCVATDINAYINKASKLIKDSKLRSEIGLWCRSFVEDNLSWEATTQKLFKILESYSN